MASVQRSVLAWDGPTRAFKWTLVLLVLNAWVSDKFGAAVPAWHKWNGYAVLTLIVFRVFWGFFGGTTARFATFVPSPRQAVAQLRALIAGRAPHYLGHNPVGALMVLALIGGLTLQGVTGLFSGDEDRVVIEGPLARTVSDATVDYISRWHHKIFDALEILILAHIAANLIYQFVKREPLITAMVTGYKPAETFADEPVDQPGSWGVAAACLAAAAVVVFGGIYLAGGKVF
ncbi:MAG: cytochrome b/b6 domain-containing protein [Hyphomicrobiales bacterium]|nr:cytochrome b/b6 domain-containing protein [Hyphomicrobiales bacterium]